MMNIHGICVLSLLNCCRFGTKRSQLVGDDDDDDGADC